MLRPLIKTLDIHRGLMRPTGRKFFAPAKLDFLTAGLPMSERKKRNLLRF